MSHVDDVVVVVLLLLHSANLSLVWPSSFLLVWIWFLQLFLFPVCGFSDFTTECVAFVARSREIKLALLR